MGKSHIRFYLNGSPDGYQDKVPIFLNTFNPAEKEQIVPVERKVTKYDPIQGEYDDGTTQDKIFLLSIEEVLKVFGDSKCENHTGSPAICINDSFNNARIAYDETGKACNWWLRTLSRKDMHNAVFIDDAGRINLVGAKIQDKSIGIRPALWLKI